jgi:hypothetical protein
MKFEMLSAMGLGLPEWSAMEDSVVRKVCKAYEQGDAADAMRSGARSSGGHGCVFLLNLSGEMREGSSARFRRSKVADCVGSDRRRDKVFRHAAHRACEERERRNLNSSSSTATASVQARDATIAARREINPSSPEEIFDRCMREHPPPGRRI